MGTGWKDQPVPKTFLANKKNKQASCCRRSAPSSCCRHSGPELHLVAVAAPAAALRAARAGRRSCCRDRARSSLGRRAAKNRRPRAPARAPLALHRPSGRHRARPRTARAREVRRRPTEVGEEGPRSGNAPGPPPDPTSTTRREEARSRRRPPWTPPAQSDRDSRSAAGRHCSDRDGPSACCSA